MTIFFYALSINLVEREIRNYFCLDIHALVGGGGKCSDQKSDMLFLFHYFIFILFFWSVNEVFKKKIAMIANLFFFPNKSRVNYLNYVI